MASLDDTLMHQAEVNVGKRWEMKYGFINHNCQDYVIQVLREYLKLKRESRSDSGKCSSGSG